ncbi:DegV family protein [Paeniglutamicibacter sulfureus]|uniref:DegV family protein with EDD domain n=1 Tax=Paeniglutamicibacter sulfureus TaxID=43666 RepID=A0ABU2BEA9_9MICC|nr:DegV family protein [Paeniglutamicibacter sulfureus]MDR7356606.1 DegV family protein with EDD domain [Paeniglutamicibacter sulfureus]
MDASQPPPNPQRPTRTGGWMGRLWKQRVADPAHRARPARGLVPVGVVSDSAAALPEDWVRQHARFLRVVPMPVMVDEQIFSEGTDDVPTELALGLAMGKAVRTSRPAPGQMLRAYRELADAGVKEIISIHLSSALSGTVDAARLAAESSPVPVTVVDSLTVALAEGFTVMDVVELAAAGAPLAELEAVANRAAENHVYFAVPSLEQLRRGGRIGTLASVLGTLLNVKPILSVRDGQIVAHEKVRTHSRTLARLVAIARDEAAARGPEARLAVHYFGNQDAAEEIVQELAGASLLEVLAVPVPAVLGAHTGAGVLAVAISGGIAPPVPGPVRHEPKTKAEPKPRPEPKAKPVARPRNIEPRRESRRRTASPSAQGTPVTPTSASPDEPANPEASGTP